MVDFIGTGRCRRTEYGWCRRRILWILSRGLAIGVSAFLLITDNQNTGTHADLFQAFICGLIPDNQR